MAHLSMNLPNKLTLGRLVLTVIFVTVTASPHGWGQGWAYSVGMAIFGIASVTDYLDGYWARKYGLITNFGKLMDPLVDKVLMCAAFVLLTETVYPDTSLVILPGWVTVAVLAREFLVTGLRLVATAQGQVLAADQWGKHKTGWQIGTASYFLVYLACQEPAMAWFSPFFTWPGLGPHQVGVLLISLTLVTTVYSGWRYFWNNRAIVLKEM
jgi:CDP-diacylglycerol---glycerol-3-phosphate 3-phosphatidyltransferase